MQWIHAVSTNLDQYLRQKQFEIVIEEIRVDGCANCPVTDGCMVKVRGDVIPQRTLDCYNRIGDWLNQPVET